jgi:hypothetical protein
MLKSNEKCLNLGSGKVNFQRYNDYGMTVHVDQSYKNVASMETIVNDFTTPFVESKQYLHQSNIFDFIDSFPYKFDIVFAERIFEHMDYVNGEIGRLLEGINVLTYKSAKLSIVVPNAILISEILCDIEKNHAKMGYVETLNKMLIVNTENHNFRHDPHCSSWTPTTAKFYIESEGTWKIDSIEEQIKFAGRDIYMRILCSKVQ